MVFYQNINILLSEEVSHIFILILTSTFPLTIYDFFSVKQLSHSFQNTELRSNINLSRNR